MPLTTFTLTSINGQHGVKESRCALDRILTGAGRASEHGRSASTYALGLDHSTRVCLPREA